VILEWKSKQWRGHSSIAVADPIIEQLVADCAVVYDSARLPNVFKDVERSEFNEIQRAIEDRPSMYDDDSQRVP
jgi:hypothetical protein